MMILTLICLTLSTMVHGITIPTTLGNVTGNTLNPSTKYVGSQMVYEFMGLRYAFPPVGNQRFRQSKVWNTIIPEYDATYPRAACIQIPNNTGLKISEDCLFLNIWTPASAVTKKSSLPVMVFIHGGSFLSGSGAEPVYNGTYLALRNVVAVTINYRLGPLGFLASESLAKEDASFPSNGGMNGLQDQVVSLQWIKNNIASFGGNGSDITIFGQSAGGLSVCDLLVATTAKNLFHRGISESGPCVGPWQPATEKMGLNQTQVAMAANGYSTIAELRAITDASSLIEKLLKPLNGNWVPSVDTYVLTDLPKGMMKNIALKNEYLNAKQVIFGYNSQDGLASWPWFVGFQPKTKNELQTKLSQYLSTSVVDQLMNKYYTGDAAIAWYGMNGDLCVGCPTYDTESAVQQTKTTVFLYEFKGTTYPYEAPHGGEIPFVFNVPLAAFYFREVFNDLTSFMMMQSWVKFATMGIPSFQPCFSCNRIVAWQPYANGQGVVVFSNDGTFSLGYEKVYRNGACPFLDGNVTAEQRQALCYI